MGKGDEKTLAMRLDKDLKNFALCLVACNDPGLCHNLLEVSKYLKTECMKISALYAKICATCGKKTCDCWKEINCKQVIRHGITSFEINYFGVNLVTMWQQVKFLGSSFCKLKDNEKIIYSLCLDLWLCISSWIFGHKIMYSIMRKALLSRGKKMQAKSFRLPIVLYLEKTPYIEIGRYNRCTKNTATKIKKNVPNMKQLLQENCCCINDLYVKK
ncbi:MAG: hypothetical protein CMO44_12815 [Verrucomicrobiales bacterium]|nr:hypothetical protein [Verrucomicrobiales bacterium]